MLRNLIRSRKANRHREAPCALPDGVRVYAVGDVHGRADCLDDLETVIKRHEADAPPGDATVIFLGDYIDRGPASRDVLERLSSPGFAGLPARYLLGNHEEAMLRFLLQPAEAALWLEYGGLATLASYGVPASVAASEAELAATRDTLANVLPAHHLDFLERLEMWVEIGDYLFVHAGIRPGVPLARQRRRDLLEIRAPFLEHARPMGWRVVHGHTVFPEAEITPHRISLDTGAYATGRLTCAVLQCDETELLYGTPQKSRNGSNIK